VKTSFVSSHAISQALRYSMMRMQADLAKGQQEVATGRVADPGLALGARTGQSVSLARDVERLNGLADSNGLVAARLKATQSALSQLAIHGEELRSTLAAGITGNASFTVARSQGQTALDSLNVVLNTTFNGQYLFAGINTDVQPINAFDAGSPSRAAFDQAFADHFGFPRSDPAVQTITGAQMDAFLAAAVEPQFLGAGWATNWSNATDEAITARIALNETTSTSVSANIGGARKLAMAAAIVAEFLQPPLSAEAGHAVMERSAELVSEGIAEIAQTQSETGIVENRIKNANERLAMQIDLFERTVQDMEGVDPYEASTRVSALMTQIETSYALTARIQQLSLLRFLA
jgi:flagellar hook-associated protein 3 FlgL